MPRHQQVNTCRLSGGPVSKRCTCEHCALYMCAVCGAYEGGLTTDCPGTQIEFNKQREVYETPLDYTDDRGWHQGEPMEHRSPRFSTSRLAPEPPRVDPRAVVAPSIDWGMVDRSAGLQHDLALRAVAWVLADRDCDDLSAALSLAKDAIDAHVGDTEHEGRMRDLRARLKGTEINFQRAYLLVEERDDAFRQSARTLVAALEAPGMRVRQDS